MGYHNAEERLEWANQVLDRALGSRTYQLEDAISLGKGAPSLKQQLNSVYKTPEWLNRLMDPAKKGTDLVKSMYG